MEESISNGNGIIKRYPDLNYGPPIGPHGDYGVRGSSQTFRIFPNGNILPK